MSVTDRQQVTFFARTKNVTQKIRPHTVCPAGSRALYVTIVYLLKFSISLTSLTGRFHSHPCSRKLNLPSLANYPFMETMHGKQRDGKVNQNRYELLGFGL